MGELSKLPNIGKVAEESLIKVGIKTVSDLKKVGSKKALLLIREKVDSGACLSMLYGLEGAIMGIRWHDLPDEVKEDLKKFYSKL